MYNKTTRWIATMIRAEEDNAFDFMEALATLTEGTKLAPVLQFVGVLAMVQQFLPVVRNLAPDMQRAITDSVTQLSDTMVQQLGLPGDAFGQGSVLGTFGGGITDDTNLESPAQLTGAVGMAHQIFADMKQVAPDVRQAVNAGARRLSTGARRLSITVIEAVQKTGQGGNSTGGKEGGGGEDGGNRGLGLKELGLGLLGGGLGSAADDAKTDVMSKVMSVLDKENLELSDITQLAPDIYDAMNEAMSEVVQQMGDGAEISSILEMLASAADSTNMGPVLQLFAAFNTAQQLLSDMV